MPDGRITVDEVWAVFLREGKEPKRFRFLCHIEEFGIQDRAYNECFSLGFDNCGGRHRYKAFGRPDKERDEGRDAQGIYDGRLAYIVCRERWAAKQRRMQCESK